MTELVTTSFKLLIKVRENNPNKGVNESEFDNEKILIVVSLQWNLFYYFIFRSNNYQLLEQRLIIRETRVSAHAQVTDICFPI